MKAQTRAGSIVKLLLVAIAWGACCAWSQAEAATIAWNGMQWNVKSGTGMGPGVNDWNPANVFVDANGDLHLAITNIGGKWTCGEVWSDTAFSFGTLQWQLKTAVDNLDPNVVLGLIAYGPPALGPDGTHEIDIEYSRFGSATGDNGRWTVFPNVLVNPTPPPLTRTTYGLALGGDPTTTSRFTWTKFNVSFETLLGYQSPDSETNVAGSWSYRPSNPYTSISPSPMPIHMNLWLLNGSPPTNGQNTEVVVHSFSFTPAAATASVPAVPGDRLFVLAFCLIGVGLILVGRATVSATA
jgi:hypothetical protein